jgi:hypothetical protein
MISRKSYSIGYGSSIQQGVGLKWESLAIVGVVGVIGDVVIQQCLYKTVIFSRRASRSFAETALVKPLLVQDCNIFL